MGGLGGGGSEIVQSYLREARREEARRDAKRESRRAFRQALRVAGYVSEHETRLPFPCALLCANCGRLHWPLDPTGGDPHRRGPDDVVLECVHCRRQTLLDLQECSIASALIETEAYDLRQRKRFKRLVNLSLAAMSVGAAAGVAMVAAPPLGVLAVVGAAGVVGFGFTIDASASRRELPRRWSLAPRPRGRKQLRARGRIVAEKHLVAPLSGRECVAFEIGVRYDKKLRARASSWGLLEQHHVAFAVGDARVSENSTYFELRRERYVAGDADLERVQRYLQERGLDPYARNLVICETIVARGESVDLHEAADGALIRRT